MTLTVASAQYPITEHSNFTSWQQHTENWVKKAVEDNASLLLFPEYGAMELVSLFPEDVREDIRRQVQALENLREDFCRTYEALAVKYKCIIIAPSFPVADHGGYVNRAFVFSPTGQAGYQDKFFMTRFENEDWGIQSGEKVLTLFDTDWGAFGIQICYDTEFSLGAQLLCAAGATFILAPSCTETIRGATRVHIGARARALENQAYTVVSQTVGNAPWSPAVDINYGYAAFYATPDKDLPEEGILASMSPQQEGWLVHTLDFTKIENVRSDGQVFNFADTQKTTIGFRDHEITIRRFSLRG
ncbi:hypothetical protein DYBT9275_04109 [Dyadobacter sp. CECT 9275]|uniref:CN hydrolase domain-containing protein n=1 Tax=Dyadobacter helix TaxID=2822344 RepID=A0A916NDE7_9BACT|nr:carbon-nitrogen hydrolase family protein [Dyadobacter sp. CECT 9275]CAG5007711.1 hypothetical protein DYBT9275_04109 [Dyadobacter sp. CECT 9275]